jgi:hypothetical protein
MLSAKLFVKGVASALDGLAARIVSHTLKGGNAVFGGVKLPQPNGHIGSLFAGQERFPIV